MNTLKNRFMKKWQVFLWVLIIFGMLSACTTPTPTTTPTSSPAIIPETETLEATQTPTEVITPTPTQAELGNLGNPISLGFILTPDETGAIEAAEEIAVLIGEDTGYAVESSIYPDFQSLAIDAQNGVVHLFWLKPLEYIYLNWEGAAQVVLVTNHLGVYAYGVQFIANIDRGFRSYFDPETNQSTGEVNQALQQFSGTRPCFINSSSIPGYFVPLGLLENASTPTLDPVFTQSYNATIRALFIQGICDFGVTYALNGDPLNDIDIVQNLPEAQDQIEVIWQSEGIIPNINLSASSNLPANIEFNIQEAVLDLPLNPVGLSLLSTALKEEIEAVKTVEDTFYNQLRIAILPLDLDLEAITHNSSTP
jgi:phosphonate transport system substrate-binding protein